MPADRPPPDDEPEPRPAGSRRSRSALFWRRRSGELDPQERRQALEQLFFERREFASYVVRFATLIVLSSTIASLGLISDSGAVVIGAMLVAPLMTPIMAVAASGVMVWPRRLLRSLLIAIVGAVGVVGVAGLMSLIVIGQDIEISEEIRSRTEPTLLDLGIALAAGAAGAYVTVRTKAGGAIPGVAIAVALVPPLASAGILMQRDETELARGALLLFVTNFAAIVLAASVLFLLTGLTPGRRAKQYRRQIAAALALAAMLVVIVAVPLADNGRILLDSAQDQQALGDAAQRFAGVNDVEVLALEIETDDPWRVEVRMAGPSSDPPDARVLADELANAVNREGRLEFDYQIQLHEELAAAP